MNRTVSIQELIGKTFTRVYLEGNEVVFENDSEQYRMSHIQDCCESFEFVDADGPLSSLEGQKIVEAREYYQEEGADSIDSQTFSFYTLRTNLDSITIQFLGESNGYYNERACLIYHPKEGGLN